MKNSTKTSTKKQKLQSHTALQLFLQKAAAYKLFRVGMRVGMRVTFATATTTTFPGQCIGSGIGEIVYLPIIVDI